MHYAYKLQFYCVKEKYLNERGIRARVQPDPAIAKKIPWHALPQGENLERIFPKLSPIDGGAEFRLREA